MNLLYVNDKTNNYPKNSWYTATSEILPEFESLNNETSVDVAIIGGGYAGLTAGLFLSKAGVDTILLEAQKVGFGASGRNGGQLGTGQRMDQRDLIKLLGDDLGDKLWYLADDALDTVKTIIKKNKIDCFLRPGIANLGNSNAEASDLHSYAEFLEKRYKSGTVGTISKEESLALCITHDYKGGILFSNAAHLHPLRYALGLAKVANENGLRIFEQSPVQKIIKGTPVVLKTNKTSIKAKYVIYACNGYLGTLEPKVASRVMPINNYIVATEPLNNPKHQVLTQDIAVADSKFVVNYFRMSHDNRLLFGGTESYRYKFPLDIASKVRKPMLKLFPQLIDAKIDYAWGGTLGITMRRMPFFKRLSKNEFNISGFSGHGVGAATHAGKLIAQTILNQDSSGFDAMEKVPSLPFPGGRFARSPLLVMAMTWYSLRDRLGF